MSIFIIPFIYYY